MTKRLSPLAAIVYLLAVTPAIAGTVLNFPVTTSEAVTVTGTPRLAIDVGGVTRYATYASASGTNTLTFTYNTQAGDLDLDGIAVTSPLDLNGGTIKDLGGNDISPLSFTVPNTANVKVDHPSLAMDFMANDYLVSGAHYASLASFLSATGGSFSRASSATYYDASGNLQTAASGIPRFDYDPVSLTAKGLLIEEARTNYVQNSQFSGITTGGPYTTGTTLGGHWQPLGAGNFATGSITITGTGTANGIPYLDLRFQGTNSGAGNGYLTFNTKTSDSFSVVTGDKTVTSAWLGVTSYSAVGGTCSIILQSRSYDSGGLYASATAVSLTSLSPWQKRETPVLNHGATAVKADGWIFLMAAPSTTCDVTVRLGAVQVEKGAFASSYIPTTSGAITRSQDLLSIPTGSWFNLNTSTLMGQGTVFGWTAGGTFQFGLGTDNQNYGYSPAICGILGIPKWREL